MTVDKMLWNNLSLLYDAELEHQRSGGRLGGHVIPMFLDYLLVDSCSEDVQEAFARALVKWVKINEERLS